MATEEEDGQKPSQPAPAAPVAQQTEAQKNAWPPSKTLEKWLMLSTKDADPGAMFLRRMLKINPAYGAYLSSNEDLAELVQLFAKKLRMRITSSPSPIPQSSLYEPLCEVVWRVVGHTFHTIMELKNNQQFPVPQMAVGQIKMLIQTNEELSRQLKDSRRAYLRELVLLREKSRIISERTQKAVDSLQDEPVMFYEPLSYVLDDTTKDFVREVVEERLKLEMKRPPTETTNDDGNDGDDLEAKLAQAIAECRHLRSQAAREADKAKRAEAEEFRLREELGKVQRMLAEKQQELDDALATIRRLNGDLSENQTKLAESRNQKDDTQRVVSNEESDEIRKMRREFDEQLRLIAELQARIAELEAENKSQAQQLHDYGKKLNDADSQRQQQSEKSKKAAEPVTQVQVISDDAELKKQLERHLDVEKELRATIRALEKALDEMKKAANDSAEQKKARKKKEPVEEEEVKIKKPKKGGAFTEEDVRIAVNEAVEKWQKKYNKLSGEHDELEEEHEATKARLKELEKELSDYLKGASADKDEQMKAYRLKQELDQLKEKYAELQKTHYALEDKVHLLIEKLRKYGGDAAVAETLKEIQLDPPPVRKNRKKKAWERLYEDALRRVVVMRERIKAREDEYLKMLRRHVGTRTASEQLKALTHLHLAYSATGKRFHDALKSFHERNEIEYPEPDDEEEEQQPLCPTCGQVLPNGILPPSPGHRGRGMERGRRRDDSASDHRSSSPSGSPPPYDDRPLRVTGMPLYGSGLYPLMGYGAHIVGGFAGFNGHSATWSGASGARSPGRDGAQSPGHGRRARSPGEGRFDWRVSDNNGSGAMASRTLAPLDSHAGANAAAGGGDGIGNPVHGVGDGARQPQPPPPGWTQLNSTSPAVLGRVPSAGALQPLPARPSPSGSRSPGDDMFGSGRDFFRPGSGDGSPLQLDELRAEPPWRRRPLVHGGDVSLLPATDTKLPATMSGGAGRPAPGVALSRSVPSLQAAQPRRSPQAIPAPLVPASPAAEPTGQRFFVTPLNSQQAMTQSGGVMVS